MIGHFKLISGTANRQLAEEVSKILGAPLTEVECKKFSDGELYFRILESVRGCEVFLIQPTAPPTNDSLMELLIMTDAIRRASPREITAVIPYYGYARQDRKADAREPITAKLVANLITVAGIDRVVIFDLHVPQIQGFFDIQVDNLEAIPILAEYFLDKKLKNAVIVAPDVGGVGRARSVAKLLNASLALIDKRRPTHGTSQVMHVIGDVTGKTAILVDDMIDTAGTITKAAEAVMKEGAKEVFIAATHAVFSGNAVEKLQSKYIKEVVVTDTIAIPKAKRFKSLTVLSVAQVLSESIKRIYEGEPMGLLFDGMYSKLKAMQGSK